MNISIKKRLLSLLLAVVMILGLIPAVTTPEAKAATQVSVSALKASLDSAAWPNAERKDLLPSSMNGHWLIVAYKHNSKQPTGYNLGSINPDNPSAWDDSSSANANGHRGYGVFETVVYSAASGSYSYITAQTPNWKSILTLSGSSTSFTVRTYDGRYWNLNKNTSASYDNFDLSSTPSYLKAVSTGSGLFCTSTTDDSIKVHSNGYTFRAMDSTNTAQDAYYFKYCDEILQMRFALTEASSYLIENYSERYDAATYEKMLEVVLDAYQLYSTNYLSMDSYISSSLRASFAQKTEAVYEALGAVKLSDKQQDYIDIPIEVFDFRGDGILFENSGTTPYALSSSSLSSLPENFPGLVSNGAISDLAYKTLVSGNIVHTQKTVDYVAEHLSKQTALVEPKNQMNRHIYETIKSGRLTYDANDYALTVAKCSPAVEGGRLAWNDIETYHDLAYYLLSNMWRTSGDVIGTDTLPSGESYDATYNLPVSELRGLRLMKNASGSYSYSSAKQSSYDNGYIVNVSENTISDSYTDPAFKPLDGKGFERSDLYGTATESASDNAHNYLFTIHAYGSFVFYEDSNLYLTFNGDDDAYFYINDELVCDLGGMHSAAQKSIALNDYIEKLNLTEGQLCRLDLFYAERHTTGINMNLTTNIELMDADVITEETQYDPETEQPLVNNAVVAVGCDVGYAFRLTNRRSAPVKELVFADANLGISFDGKNETMTLNDSTKLSDLTVIFSSFGSSENATVCDDFEFFRSLISAASAGTYSYQPKTEQELLSLLKSGIPASCKLTIRGIRYTMPETDFVARLTSSCTPVEYTYGADGTLVSSDAAPIKGLATCRCSARKMGAIDAGEPYSIVLDYAKTVETDLSEIHKTLSADGLTLTYVGSTFGGAHGAIRATEPKNLTFNAVGAYRETETGYFSMVTDSILRFTPTDFMSQANTFYAVYRVGSSDASFKTCYVMKAVSFVPANIVYYETDFADENINKHSTDAEGLLINFGYGDSGEWNPSHGRATATKANGVLKGDVTGTDPYVIMTNRPYNYLCKPGDVVKVRIKSAPSTGNGLQVFFTTNVNTSLSGTAYISTGVAEYYPNNQWQTITLPIWSNVFGQTIQAIRIDPIGNNNSFQSTGSYEIDWVYIGPDDSFNAPVIFDFDSSDATVWEVHGNTVSKENGTLKVTCTGENDPFITMAVDSCKLGYVVTENDIVRLRVKSPVGSGNGLQVFFMTDTNNRPATGIETEFANYVPNGEWQTIEVNIKSALIGKQITGIRLDQPDYVSADATIEYDWVYIGPKQNKTDDPFRFASTTQNAWSYVGSAENVLQQAMPNGASVTYGHDKSYTKVGSISNNSTYFVVGEGIPTLNADNSVNYEDTYTEVSFRFTGTGFDIISRAGPDQGNLLALVYKQADSSLVRSVKVSNKRETDLYQFPVLSVKDLAYGEYIVKIFVDAPYSDEKYPELNHGGEFYFDAVRIYDPIDVSTDTFDAEIAYNAYLSHGEADAAFARLQETIYDDESLIAGGGEVSGAVYIESKTADKKTSLASYESVGANEVYLPQGKAISFKLEAIRELPYRVDIAVRSADGSGSVMNSSFSDAPLSALPTGNSRAITSSTAQYYSLGIDPSAWTETDGKKYVYVTIGNSAAGLLAITDIKYAYDTASKAETRSASGRDLRFVVDEAIYAVYGVCYQHSYSTVVTAPTCTEDGYTTHTCASCNHILIDSEIAATGHSAVVDEAYAPTCTESGCLEGSHCEICGEILVQQGVIAALGHNEIVDARVEATCTETGLTEGKHCSVCGETLLAQETIDALGHTEIIDAAIEAECEATGLTEGKHCGVCGKVLIAQEITEATGHSVVIDTAVAPKCESNGLTEGTHCETCGKVLLAQEIIDMLGHSFDEGVITVAPTCLEEGTKLYTCHCGSEKTEPVAALGHKVHYHEKVNATCTETGLRAYYECEQCGKTYIDADCSYELPTKYMVISAKGHTYESAVTAPTCTEQGFTSYTCFACGDSFKTDEVAALGHTEVIDEAVAPTCTETGLTEGKHCSVCSEVIVAQTTVDALGHSYRYMNEGENHAVTCDNCDFADTASHEFIDGTCICGAVESTDPIPDASLKFSMNISVGAEMSVSYNVMASAVNKYADFYLEISKASPEGDPTVITYGLTEGHEQMNNLANFIYSATFNGISAKQMGDEFSTTLYAIDSNGKLYKGETVTESIKDYLIKKASEESATAEFKTMAVDMLTYGAAAQTIFSYGADNLVTADLSDELLAFATAEIPTATDIFATSGNGANISVVVTVGSRVELGLSVFKAGLTNPENVRCEIRDSDGNLLAEPEITNTANVIFAAGYSNVGAREMRKPITATFFMGDEQISQTITWSVESYVAQTRASANATASDIAMVDSMLTYGDAVANYLTSIGQ